MPAVAVTPVVTTGNPVKVRVAGDSTTPPAAAADTAEWGRHRLTLVRVALPMAHRHRPICRGVAVEVA